MSKPEIFRRCLACGASFRTSALFCPHCGNAARPEKEKASAADERFEEPVRHVPLNPGRAGARAEQAGTAPRDAREDKVKPRTDKIRKASSIIIDEAASDPGVRFLLVAAILFVLFLVLLFLSKWMS